MVGTDLHKEAAVVEVVVAEEMIGLTIEEIATVVIRIMVVGKTGDLNNLHKKFRLAFLLQSVASSLVVVSYFGQRQQSLFVAKLLHGTSSFLVEELSSRLPLLSASKEESWMV